MSGKNTLLIGGKSPGNSPPQVERKFPMRETVEERVFLAENQKKGYFTYENTETLELLRVKQQKGGVLA